MSGKPRTLFRAEEIAELVRRLGAEISADHPEGLALVGVLKGSVCLVADLARAIACRACSTSWRSAPTQAARHACAS